jgi:hypothetical protein
MASLCTPALPAVDLAERHAEGRAGLADHAGCGDGRGDVGDAAHHRVLAEDRHQPLRCVDAVLHRDHRGVRSDHRLDVPAGALDVPQLDAEQHDVDRPDLGGIVGRLCELEVGVAARTLDLEAILLHRREVRAAGDEGHVRAGMRQRRAVAAAHAARSDYRDTHRTLPSKIVPSRTASMVGRSTSRRKQ